MKKREEQIFGGGSSYPGPEPGSLRRTYGYASDSSDVDPTTQLLNLIRRIKKAKKCLRRDQPI